ncbi:hypothetical protein AUC68_06025 [Methyloceanibacter methanicus]|uniref:Rod shape-determining protein MreC beta-barrel core domain-containing protein n=1 Tax=Methyloceanibacter methanicus TaxID=1774968 RepID=A0A1E3VYX0_9HYPH|nr:rod shape-determining protein MreC [Methyloceanibacter methanicus]ODR98765.1 hypothetical protein AUC68_06025 [Methyloceanibacter methanicus]
MPKRSPSLFQRHRPSWTAPVELLSFGLYFLCAVLLVLSRIGHGALADARDELVDLSAPLLELASVPAIEARRAIDRVRLHVRVHQNGVEEIDRLTKENDELKQWRWRTQLLERKVAHLRKLLHAAEDPALVYASGRVIADARGPFVRSALVNLGRQDGVRIGYAVINGDGLVGRTVEAGDNVARVLLLNDLNSVSPFLWGQEAPAPWRSETMAPSCSLASWKRARKSSWAMRSTPRAATASCRGALGVGVVAGKPGAYTVRPFAELNSLDVVSVLFFDAPALKRTDPAVVADKGGALSAAPRPEPEDDRTAAGPAVPLPPVASMAAPAASVSPPVASISPPVVGQAQAER